MTEFDPARKDAAIAEAAVEQLRADSHRGHILMARVGNVQRAAEVFECYRGYTEFNPVQIHTGITSKTEREEIRKKLISGESRIVVCVDMLGEGFDLPELKIAAFHDIRKTLAVTLQLVGRFTRTRADLGDATFVANIADLEVKDELKRLYQHDSDWNALLPLLDDRVTEGEFNLREFLPHWGRLALMVCNKQPNDSAHLRRNTVFSDHKTVVLFLTPDHLEEMIHIKERGEEPANLILDLIELFYLQHE